MSLSHTVLSRRPRRARTGGPVTYPSPEPRRAPNIPATLPEGYPALEDLIWSGRRNITPQQRTYLIGKMYQETKKEQGGTGANQHTEQSGNNYHSAKTEDRIAEQFNVAPKTVRNAEKFADAVDTIASTYGDEA